LLGISVEACCDVRTGCVAGVATHPLIAATHLAFSQHRPLVLSPDMIWLTLLQGFARHVKNNAESLRSKFVLHEGRLDLVITRNDFFPKSPDNPWDEVVKDFSSEIKPHLRVPYSDFIVDFSTTGAFERTACEVAIMDAFQNYFQYVLICFCGIPRITLEGTLEDWQRLRSQVEVLAPFDLEWWLPEVRRICDHFVLAAEGNVDREHWGDIYKRRAAYGGDVLNGWMSRLIPYVKGERGQLTSRNPLLSDPDAYISSHSFSTGMSRVPVIMQNALRGTWRNMEILGGFVGVTQDHESLALRPKLGWAVRDADDDVRFDS
jgi:hypothetical protein